MTGAHPDEDHEIPQARAVGAINGVKRVVSYYAAAWRVKIRCVQAGGGGNVDDGSGGSEGDMDEPPDRGERNSR